MLGLYCQQTYFKVNQTSGCMKFFNILWDTFSTSPGEIFHEWLSHWLTVEQWFILPWTSPKYNHLITGNKSLEEQLQLEHFLTIWNQTLNTTFHPNSFYHAIMNLSINLLPICLHFLFCLMLSTFYPLWEYKLSIPKLFLLSFCRVGLSMFRETTVKNQQSISIK